MRVLRVGGEYLAAQQSRARTALLTIAGTGAAGTAVASVSLHPVAGAFLLLGTASVAAKIYRRYRRFSKGIRGETLVTELLGKLPDEYFLVNDVVLPGHEGNIDHVVIGPCGVVVIETKHFSGPVESHGNAWFVNGRWRRSVSAQVNGGAIAVREALSRAHPDLKDSILHFVDSVAVFTNPSSRLKVDRARTTVARYSQLLDVILAKARRKRVPPPVTARLATSLLNALPAGAPGFRSRRRP